MEPNVLRSSCRQLNGREACCKRESAVRSLLRSGQRGNLQHRDLAPRVSMWYLYHDQQSWNSFPNASTRDSVAGEVEFRGMRLRGALRDASDHDARWLFPPLEDTTFQDQLGEFGGLIALANNEWLLHNDTQFVGISSLKRPVEPKVLGQLARGALCKDKAAGSVFYYVTCCGEQGTDISGDLTRQQLPRGHTDFMDLFGLLHRVTRQQLGFELQTTRMPRGEPWSYKSALLLPRAAFRGFACFIRLIVAEISRLHQPTGKCFLKANGVHMRQRCWSYLLERTFNFWAYNAGYRLVYFAGLGGTAPQKAELHRRGGAWEVYSGRSRRLDKGAVRTLRHCDTTVSLRKLC